MNATERLLDLVYRLAGQTDTDVVNALDLGAILNLGNAELLDIVDGLEAAGLVHRVLGAGATENNRADA
jgi:hypothetical protein